MALTKIDDRGLTTPIDLLDNEKIRFGTGNDLEAYHSSSDNNSYIQHTQNGTSLIVKSDYFIVSENQSTDIVMRAAAGVAELYNNNVKKLETTANGISVSAGAADTTSVLQVSSSGSGRADMRITASGTGAANLFLDAANGDLSGADYVGIFQDNDLDFCIQNYGGDVTLKTRGGTLGSGDIDNAIVCKQEGTVEVYYNNSKKLETITNGVKVHTNLYAQGAGEISLAIGSTDAGGAAIYFDGDSNGDWSGGDYSRIRHTTAGDMEYDADNPAGATNHIFMTAGTERLRIDSSGNVGIGCTPSNGVLEVKDTSYDGGSTGLLTLEGGGESGVMFKTSSYGNDQNKIGTNNNGHMFFRVAAGTRASLTSDGLCFGSDTAASNALGDYEEGTFSPQITEGISSQSYSEQHGRYTKIGNKVHLDFYLRINDADANGSHYKIGNFPFTINNSGFVRGGGCTTYFSLNTGASGSNATAQFYGSGGGTYANLYQGSTLVAGTNGAANDALYLIGFFEYTT